MFRDAFGMGDGRRSRPRQPQSDERLVALGLVLLIWALVVAGRLFGLQVVHHEVYRNLAESQQDKLEKIEARRGSIFDHNGNYLALSSASKRNPLSRNTTGASSAEPRRICPSERLNRRRAMA